VQPGRRRSRSAVVGEHDRPRARIAVAAHIGGEAKQGDGLVLVVLHQHRARRGGIADRRAAYPPLVLGDEHFRFGDLVLGLCRRVLFRIRICIASEDSLREGAGERECAKRCSKSIHHRRSPESWMEVDATTHDQPDLAAPTSARIKMDRQAHPMDHAATCRETATTSELRFAAAPGSIRRRSHRRSTWL
jgi:hypothetical protein